MSAQPRFTRIDALILGLAVLLVGLLIALTTGIWQIGRNSECETPAPRPSVSSTPSPTVPTPQPSKPPTGSTAGGGTGLPPTKPPMPTRTNSPDRGVADDAGGV